MNKTELGVRAILQNPDNEILLVRNNHGLHERKWVLPGGRVEFKEAATDAIKREVLEELGLYFDPEFFCYMEDVESREDTHFIALFFTGTYTGEIKSQEGEIDDHQFFTIDEIKEMDNIGFGHKAVLWENRERLLNTS